MTLFSARKHTELVQGNIEIHLDFIYPLNSTIRASSPRFLYDNVSSTHYHKTRDLTLLSLFSP